MDEFPGNRQQSRARPEKQDRPAEKKVDKVIEGEVVRRKTTLGKRIKTTFIGGDARSVWSYMAEEVLIPAFKDTIADAFTQGFERMIFGDNSRHIGRRDRHRGGNNYRNYQQYSSGGRREDPRDRDRPHLSRRARANFDFDEILLPTRAEADQVLERMYDLLSQYEIVTVKDLYELVGIDSNYTDEKYGWEDLRGADVTRVGRDGYLLDLPRPEPLR